jgi:hypothetical protein
MGASIDEYQIWPDRLDGMDQVRIESVDYGSHEKFILTSAENSLKRVNISGTPGEVVKPEEAVHLVPERLEGSADRRFVQLGMSVTDNQDSHTGLPR